MEDEKCNIPFPEQGLLLSGGPTWAGGGADRRGPCRKYEYPNIETLEAWYSKCARADFCCSSALGTVLTLDLHHYIVWPPIASCPELSCTHSSLVEYCRPSQLHSCS